MADMAAKDVQKMGGEGQPPAPRSESWHPFHALRREIDRLFDDFPFGRPSVDLDPFWRRELGFIATPAVDIAEKDDAYEITAELPGMAEKDVDVSHSGGRLVIKGEKKAESEEKKKDYYLSERRYGSFQRSFAIPDGVDAARIEAHFKNGLLTVTLPKTPEARQATTTIPVKPV